MYYESNDYLAHHGVKGMKWGVRRYQRSDGSYTPTGRRYRAKEAGRKAAQESWDNSRATMNGRKLGSGRKALNAASKARQQAELASLQADRAHNQRIKNGDSDIRRKYDTAKAEKKQADKEYKESFNNAYNRSIAAYSPSKKARQRNDERWQDALNKADVSNQKRAEYKQAKKERKDAIDNAYNDINSNASFGKRLVYNDKTRKTAAKYVVDHNMTIAEANKRAESEAWRNTAAFVAVYGGVTAAAVYKYYK